MFTPFNIVWGKLERLDKSVVGSLVINVLPSQLEAVEKFVAEKGVIYEIVERK